MERGEMVHGEKALYTKIHQPTIASWLNKTQVMTMLTQTREKRTIHPKKCKEMILPKRSYRTSGKPTQSHYGENSNAAGEGRTRARR